MKQPQPLLVCTPEITVRPLVPGVDLFLILACDGVYDVLSDTDVISTALGAKQTPKHADSKEGSKDSKEGSKDSKEGSKDSKEGSKDSKEGSKDSKEGEGSNENFDPKDMAGLVVRRSYEQGSTDNISVIAICFKEF